MKHDFNSNTVLESLNKHPLRLHFFSLHPQLQIYFADQPPDYSQSTTTNPSPCSNTTRLQVRFPDSFHSQTTKSQQHNKDSKHIKIPNEVPTHSQLVHPHPSLKPDSANSQQSPDHNIYTITILSIILSNITNSTTSLIKMACQSKSVRAAAAATTTKQ